MHALGGELQRYKRSLVHLDIDIRHENCHPYKTNCKGTKEPKNGILLGSLTEFEVLKKLEIGVDELCGHPNWMPSPVLLVDLLPRGLESLRLRVVVKRRNEGGQTEFENLLILLQQR